MAQLPYKLSQAEQDVLDERRGQRMREGFDSAHDDSNQNMEMAGAAACYAMRAVLDSMDEYRLRNLVKSTISECWPWPNKWWKPTTPRRDLVKAGALILAEIERLDRATARETGGAA